MARSVLECCPPQSEGIRRLAIVSARIVGRVWADKEQAVMTEALNSQINAAAPAFHDFHHLASGLPPGGPCVGTACFAAARRRGAGNDLTADPQRVHCLGRCYDAPVEVGTADPGPRFVETAPGVEPVILAGLIAGSGSLDAYRARGGYQALADALERERDDLIQQVEEAGIRGRGGAAFPVGQKWAAVAAADGPAKFVIANADEGDPGAYIDRFLIERDPHLLIEGMVLAGIAVGAERGFVYLRLEYPEAARSLRRALAEARSSGIIGGSVLGEGRAFDIEVFVGEGSYLCGEETALIHSIEGRRPEPSPRPPYPTSSGLFGMPTLVNNVETLCAIPWIQRRGGRRYAEMGVAGSTGTKVVSLNSLFNRPGLFEVEFGTPLRVIVEELGGGLVAGDLLGILVGGPLAGMVPAHLIDTPFAFDELAAIGCNVGHGGIVAFDKSVSIAEVIAHVAAFAAYESCGKCTPCRTGSGELARATGDGELAGADASGRKQLAAPMSRPAFDSLVDALVLTSLCGHGEGLGKFARAMLRHFPEEVAECLG